MKENYLNQMEEYMAYLEQEERSVSTRQQYERDIKKFLLYLGDTQLTKEVVIKYKERLQATLRPSSVNTKIAALNGFFSFIGKANLRVKQLRIQRKTYSTKEKELTKAEYLRLIETAEQKKNQRLSLLIQTICSTGIRVSELTYITAEAVHAGEAMIQLKGKSRSILISGKLRKALKEYMRRNKILSCPIFISRNGNPIDRSNIWRMMKALCKSAKVDSGKVFPHSLRHLFARCFYAKEKDIAKLADILGHSSINTTRIYIISSGTEHRRKMDALGLVVAV